ncbi:RNase adapter RapZ [Microcella daejeonensis]|uniref:RNase adapter RapZ n=1 Tax=Microcella daejeonensis TaxID=2994971 RepID=A0A9E8MKH8_9MICO|nr:RNase adapter RapZ [Microcella daejeonensis]WAB81234.1 RNase adapter RapZ [Microcella daejeonensis]WAB83400.1 RNase adapter RapZ [Microcella daejeonensis]
MMQNAHDVLIVTGMSGAGRSTVANALEDLGWYVVDNLPPQMLRPLVDLAVHPGSALPKIAAVVDVRGGKLFADLALIIDELRDRATVRVLFLEATDAALVRRFEQVRRPHPLQADGTILDGIAQERQRMLEVRELSDIIIDTSELNIHQLATAVSQIFAPAGTADVKLTLESFGFKYGAPTDVDMIADARFLPNPFWQEDLRSSTGLDAAVSEYVLGQEGAQEFLDAYFAALQPVLAGYARENKRHATIAIGCTGGKHRSVAMIEQLAARVRALPGIAVTVKHRDLGRE